MMDLDIPIMIIYFWTNPDFFQDNSVLLFEIELGFPLLLIQMFAVIHNPAYRRSGGWRHFYQIQLGIVCPLKGFFYINNTHLLVIFVNQPYGADANPLIDSQIILVINSCSPFN